MKINKQGKKTPEKVPHEASIGLKDNEDSFYQMIEAMPQMVWITRPDGYHEFYNKHWYEFTNTTFEDTKGERWNDMFHPEDAKKAWKMWKDSLKTGKPYQIEYRLKNGNTGEWHWVLGRALPLRGKSGEIIKWIGTCTDIDEQKNNTQNMQFLSDASKILSTSLDFQTTLRNIAKLAVPDIADWCTIDLKQDDSIKQLAVAHVDPKKIAWAKELNQKNKPDMHASTGVPQVLRSGKAEFYPHVTDEMLVAGAKDEEQLKLMRDIGFRSVIIVPLTSNNGPIGTITFVTAESERHYKKRDLLMAEELGNRASLAIQNSQLYTSAQNELKQRKRLEKDLLAAKQTLEQRVKDRTIELNILNTELQRSNRELEDFAYVASHDLQEPLRKIQAFGNLLEDEYGNKLEDGKLYIDRMQHASSRMRALIEDLLSFSRVTTKNQEMTEVNLKNLIDDTLSDMEIRITDLGAKVSLQNVPIVTADPMQMRQLFQNLISNALKFHKPDVAPQIIITSEQVNDSGQQMHQITIQDNGIGFEEKYKDRIFTVFQRLHGREAYEGTGVGLAVVRKIIERHNGTINVQSTVGKGTTFLIRLPILQNKRG